MWLLSKFNRNEIEIIVDDSTYNENQEYLQNELDEINSGKAKFQSTDEFESRLDNAIKKHENTV